MRAGAVGKDGARAHLSACRRTSAGRRGLARPTAPPVGTAPRSTRCLSAETQEGWRAMKSVLAKHDPKLDLIMEREVDVPVSLVWKVWTTPEHLKQWFCPRPWSVTHCEIDLRPERVNSA